MLSSAEWVGKSTSRNAISHACRRLGSTLQWLPHFETHLRFAAKPHRQFGFQILETYMPSFTIRSFNPHFGGYQTEIVSGLLRYLCLILVRPVMPTISG